MTKYGLESMDGELDRGEQRLAVAAVVRAAY